MCACVYASFREYSREIWLHVFCAVERCGLTQSGLLKMSETRGQKRRAQLKSLEHNANNNKTVVNYVHCNELITTLNIFKQSWACMPARADIFAVNRRNIKYGPAIVLRLNVVSGAQGETRTCRPSATALS